MAFGGKDLRRRRRAEDKRVDGGIGVVVLDVRWNGSMGIRLQRVMSPGIVKRAMARSWDGWVVVEEV